MIDIKKKYRTRDGREVRIYATDGAYSRTLHGAVKDSEGWGSMAWKSCGSVSTLSPSQSPADLVEVVMLPEYWVVFYDCDDHPRITQCEPTPRNIWTIIHHPAQEKPVT
jgi:hypothetical protein